MRRASASCLLVLVLVLAGGCAAMAGAPLPENDAGPGSDGGGFVDASPFPPPDADVPSDGSVDQPDAAPACFDVVVTPPTGPAPIEVFAHAEGPPSLPAPRWTVTGSVGENVPYTVATDDPRRISFTAGVHGVYQLVAEPACAPTAVELAPSAFEKVTFYLRYTPRPGEGVPPQDDANGFAVVKGTSELLLQQARWLTPPRTIDANISGDFGGLGAQLTFVADGVVGWPLSLFADPQGHVSGQVLDVAQTVFIVPGAGRIAPFRLHRAPEDLELTSIPFMAGTQLTGTVVDAQGAGVPDAWVSVGTDGQPPGLVKTNADGTFALDVRGGNLRFEVAPTPGAGLAQLVVPPALQVQVGGGPVRIGLADVPKVTLSGWQVKAADHTTFLGGAHVTFVAQVGGGQITQGGVTRAVPASETRVRVDTSPAGTLPDVTLPAALYDVIVEPPVATNTDVMAVTSPPLDLRAPTSPAASVLSTVPPSPFALEVVDVDGQPLHLANVTAVAQGRFGVQKGEALLGTADELGKVVAISGPPGMVYDVAIDAQRGSATPHARARVRVDSAQMLPTVPLRVQMPPTVIVSGTLLKTDHIHVAPGVTVSIHCGGLRCPDPSFIYAETTTDAAGAFHLAVPDLTKVDP